MGWFKRTLLIIGGLFGLLFVVGLITASTMPETTSDQTPTSSTSQKPATSEGSLREALDTALGDSLRGVERVASVDYFADEGLLVVKYAVQDGWDNEDILHRAWRDTGIILGVAQKSTLNIKELVVIGTFEAVDKYGASLGERPIANVTFEQDAITKANLEVLYAEDLKEIASQVNISYGLLGLTPGS